MIQVLILESYLDQIRLMQKYYVDFPIVIRRGGPRDKEAFEALKAIGKKEGFDFHIYGRETPMTSTAKIMVEKAYGNTGN